MIGLQPHAHPSPQADGVAKTRGYLAFLRYQDEVLVAHQLGDRRGHFRGDAACEFSENGRGGGVGEQPVAEGADGQRRDRRERRFVVGVEDQARDFIVFISNDALLEKLPQGNVGQRHPRRDHLLGAAGCDSREAVAGARRRGLGQEVAQIVKDVAGGIDDVAIDHNGSGSSVLIARASRSLPG
jgi:hypothetical protein